MKDIGVKTEGVGTPGGKAFDSVMLGIDPNGPSPLATVLAVGNCHACGLRWEFTQEDAPISADGYELTIEFDCKCGATIKHHEVRDHLDRPVPPE